MFYTGLLKDLVRDSSNGVITHQDLYDLDFEEVLENRWLWVNNPKVRTDGEIYVTFITDEDGETCMIEGSSMVGNFMVGNNYAGISATLSDLLTIVELLKL